MQPDEVETWKRALLRFRAQKDEFMRLGRESPFARFGQQGFHGLSYFEPDPAFRFEAKLQRYRAEASVMMTTSTGTRQLFNRVGRFDLIDRRPACRSSRPTSRRRGTTRASSSPSRTPPLGRRPTAPAATSR